LHAQAVSIGASGAPADTAVGVPWLHEGELAAWFDRAYLTGAASM
jgi:hypothetical protein